VQASLRQAAGGSALNIASKTGTIVLVSGQAVTCTIKTLASQRVATETVATLFEARQALILANQPSTDRRINRLVGQGAAGGGSVNLGGLQFANKSPFNVSIDRDFWAEGTLAKFEIGYGDGNFAILHLGADYLASKNLLVGATAQLDWIDFDTTGDATTKGKGFMVGPYITARLSENLFFDARVTAGTASNDISPYGTYVDSVDSNRTLTSAALIGSFQRGKMTVRPEARLNWFIEESDAYKDSLGVMVPSVRASTGTLDLGPEFRWSLGAKELGDVEVSVGLAGIWAFDQTLKSDANIALDRVMLPDFRARMKSGALLTLENGVVFNADVFMDGIGGGDYRSWGGSLGVRFGF
jgi:outer membrane autotransporter protein